MCTTMLVGKKASVDGSVIACQTADCGMCDFTWHYIPSADHKEGSKRKIYHISQFKTWPPGVGGKWVKYVENDTGVEIPQVPHTYGYQLSIFGHMNEHQLSIAESTIGCRGKLRNNTPAAVMDITTLTMLAMERCRTAREAIKLMGSLSEKYGYGFHDGGEMLAVADPKEIWLFEIMPVGPLWTPKSGEPGSVWCAQRVPDDHVSFCPNESRIGEIDLKDKKNFMASPNVISLAIKMGYFDPKKEKPFSWKHAYSPRFGSATGSKGGRARLWRLFDRVAPSKKFDPATENMDFPFSIKPDKKISVQDVMALMRDKYQGIQFDPASGIKGGPFANPNIFRGFRYDKKYYRGPRPISVNNAEYTTITQCRSWLPDAIGGINWIAMGAQDTTCMIPMYAGITRMPLSFSKGDHFHFDRGSARWAFDYVDFHTQVAYSHAIKDVIKAQEKWENQTFQMVAIMDQAAEKVYKKNPRQARQMITEFCINQSSAILNAWWQLGDELLVKYNHFRIYDSKSRRTRRLQHSNTWKKALVEYETLTPQQPRQRKRE
jgi:dipeptidase